mmetsp:Transcript_142478/g.454637  ORF Transcript_142478/g.454637 Transcript_142478/m.454637 type:complete len:252 (+) Transcript_142478:113-868(+)
MMDIPLQKTLQLPSSLVRHHRRRKTWKIDRKQAKCTLCINTQLLAPMFRRPPSRRRRRRQLRHQDHHKRGQRGHALVAQDFLRARDFLGDHGRLAGHRALATRGAVDDPCLAAIGHRLPSLHNRDVGPSNGASGWARRISRLLQHTGHTQHNDDGGSGRRGRGHRDLQSALRQKSRLRLILPRLRRRRIPRRLAQHVTHAARADDDAGVLGAEQATLELDNEAVEQGPAEATVLHHVPSLQDLLTPRLASI